MDSLDNQPAVPVTPTPTVPMFSPDGQLGDVPHEGVNDAVQKCFTLGQDMVSPDGKPGTIPMDKVHDAIKAGFQLHGAAPAAPSPPKMETMSTPGESLARMGDTVADNAKIEDPLLSV